MLEKHDEMLMKFPKVPAGVLSLVLSVSLVIAVLCSSLIYLAYYYRLTYLHYEITDELSAHAKSGTQYLLAESKHLSPNEWYPLKIVNDTDSILLMKKYWGVYELGISRAARGAKSKSLAVLIGEKANLIEQSALYLSDEQRPLSIAGNTNIKGNAYLPKAGIKSAYINRQGYSGSQLVYGTQKHSQHTLPPLNQEIFSSIEALLSENKDNSSYHLVPIETLDDSLTNSFFHETVYYYSQSFITLGQRLEGNIIVQSSTAIHVSHRAVLEDIILIAPQIRIMAGFKGKLQAFATDTLIVEQDSRLHYPSALGVITGATNSFLHVEPETIVEGTVFITGKTQDYQKRLLSIAEGAKIIGTVYIDGLVEHKGQIAGHLSCRKFILRTPATLYENYLFNASINHSDRSDYFISSVLWAAPNKKGIVKWLD